MTKREEVIHPIRVIEELIAIAESWEVDDEGLDRLFWELWPLVDLRDSLPVIH